MKEITNRYAKTPGESPFLISNGVTGTPTTGGKHRWVKLIKKSSIIHQVIISVIKVTRMKVNEEKLHIIQTFF